VFTHTSVKPGGFVGTACLCAPARPVYRPTWSSEPPRRGRRGGWQASASESLAAVKQSQHDVQVITVASFPKDLGTWDQNEHPYYFEVFGEAEPLLDMTHAQVIPPGGATAASASPIPIYEYWWTIGHGGSKPQHRRLFQSRKKLDLWHRLEDVAARVYLYFPISAGWRTQELAASAKYLSPVANQSDWTAKAAADWQRMQPILTGAAQAASALGVVPGVGAVAAGAAPILSAMSKLQVNAVPQGVKGFDWYVEKVTVPAAAKHGVMQGVVWTIPKEMFQLLGGRLTGSLALSFIPAAAIGQSSWEPRPMPMLAHAAVYADGHASWVPAQNRFIELPLSPQTPATSAELPAATSKAPQTNTRLGAGPQQ
jgi:hypothetical protein